MELHRRISLVLLSAFCANACSQEPAPLPDHARLAATEARVVKYFQTTPSGKCSWRRKVLRPNGETIFDMKYDIAYHKNQVYWYEQSIDSGMDMPGLDQIYILNDKARIYWPPQSEEAALQIRLLACFNGNPMMGAMLHPRYIGTGLEGIIGNLIDKSPRGIFADGGLTRVAAETTSLDGQPVLKGIYKWNVWDVEMYYTVSEPTLLLKTVTSALSNTGIHRKTVTIKYDDWDCGVRYPSKIEFDYSIKDTTTQREVVNVSDFNVLNDDEVKSKFTMAAMNFPDGRSVVVSDASCTGVDRFHKVDGKLIPWTQKDIDDFMRNLSMAAAQKRNVAQANVQPDVVAPTGQKRSWVLYSIALVLLSTCFATFIRLTRQTNAA